MRPDDFIAAALRNPRHDTVLNELTRRGLPDAWLVAGCLTQTAWNVQTGRAVDYGIHHQSADL